LNASPRVRIVLCTSGGVHGAIVLQRLLASHRVELAGVIRSTRVLSVRYDLLRGAWEQCRRSGLRYALYLGCAAAGSIAVRARANGVPVFETRDVNADGSRAFIEQLVPDLLVAAFFNQRISDTVTAMPKYAAVNIHPSLLPAFRGVDPVFFAMLRDSRKVGVTLHRLSPELDAGNVIAQQALSVAPDESVLRTTARLFDCGAGLLLASLDALLSGESGAPQAGEANYDSWPTPPQVAQLGRQGGSLVSRRDLLDIATGRPLI